MPTPGFSTPRTPAEKPRGGYIPAALLGLLTFAVTPVIALVIAIIFFFLGKILGKNLEDAGPIPIIMRLFNLQELGGFFAAEYTMIVLLALLGDLGTAAISWFIYRSRKFVMVTFVSALVFQSIYVAISLPRSFRHSEETLNADLEREKSFEQYATIGDVSFDLQEPYSDKRGINGELVELSLFRHLAIIVPISVTHPGVYQIYLQYHDNTVGGNNEFEKEVTQDLHIGSNMLRIEFPWNESRGFGYASPKIAKGGARIQLSYLASPQELFGNLKPGSSVERNILQKFMKERGFDKGLSSTSHINQFVSQKQVQF